jgi:hypothetical protein
VRQGSIFCQSSIAEEAAQTPPEKVKRQRSDIGFQLSGIIPLVPNWLVWILYLYFGYRFYRGYSRTTFDSSSKLVLTLIWPVLLITASGRRNFQRALRGDE